MVAIGCDALASSYYAAGVSDVLAKYRCGDQRGARAIMLAHETLSCKGTQSYSQDGTLEIVAFLAKRQWTISHPGLPEGRNEELTGSSVFRKT